jgi:hypothetical protein
VVKSITLRLVGYVARKKATNIMYLDIIHRHVLFKTRRFGDWILSLPSGGTYTVGGNRQIHVLMKEIRHTRTYQVLVESKSRLIVRPRHGWKNIVIDLKEKGFVSMK